MNKEYDEDSCRVILCRSVEECRKLQSLALLHGIEGGSTANTFVCKTEDINRITQIFKVEHIVTVAEVLQWSNEGARDWKGIGR